MSACLRMRLLRRLLLWYQRSMASYLSDADHGHINETVGTLSMVIRDQSPSWVEP